MKRRFLLFLTVMLINVMAAFGQTKISGTVIFQDDGEPVIGATVLVDGSKSGTVTNHYCPRKSVNICLNTL